MMKRVKKKFQRCPYERYLSKPECYKLVTELCRWPSYICYMHVTFRRQKRSDDWYVITD